MKLITKYSSTNQLFDKYEGNYVNLKDILAFFLKKVPFKVETYPGGMDVTITTIATAVNKLGKPSRDTVVAFIEAYKKEKGAA